MRVLAKARSACGLVVIVGLALGVTGCSLSLDPPGTSRVSIVIPGRPAPESTVFNALMSGQGMNAAPASSSLFDCLSLNVIGPGIAPSFGNVHDVLKFPDLLAGTSYCAYPGITAVFPNSAGTSTRVSVKVPTGPKRLIQIAGIEANGTTVCSLPRLDSSVDDSDAHFFEIGRAVADIFRDISVDVTENWNTLSAAQQDARKLDCGDGAGGAYASLIQSTAGLVAFWPLAENPGALAAENRGPSIGSMTYAGATLDAEPGPIIGQVIPATGFNGSAKASAGSTYDFSGTNTFSFEIWVKLTTCNSSAGFIYMANNAGNSQIELGCGGMSASFFAKDSMGGNATAPGGFIVDGNWHHIVGVKEDATTLRIYTDANQSAGYSGTFSVGNFSMTGFPEITEIGHNRETAAYMTGTFAFAAIYNRPLTHAEVISHYVTAGYPYNP